MKYNWKSTLIIYFILLSASANYGQITKHIEGDSLPASASICKYHVSAKLASFDWVIIPRSAGRIIDLQNDSVTVQWSSFDENSTNTCSLGVMITFPNADQSLNFSKLIKIQASSLSPKKATEINQGFSKQSKDSLRFFYQIQCDTIKSTRLLQLIDSSLNARRGLAETTWKIVDVKTKKVWSGRGLHYSVRLPAGSFSISMQSDHKTLALSDTIRLFPAAQPSFTLSSQTPCSGSALTLSNTSKHLDLALLSVFHFGNGATDVAKPPSPKVEYVYNDDASMMQIYMTRLDLKDKHGCTWQSKEIPVAVQQNKFTRFNIGVDPRQANITYAGEQIKIACKKGNPGSLPNPETPYTYQWSTGQKTANITVNKPGLYTVVVKDKIGCVSPVIGPVEVRQTYRSTKQPILQGASEMIAGQLAQFSIEPAQHVYYQFKFIFNKQQSYTTEPSEKTSIELPNWQNSKPGILQVIGITLNKTGSDHASSFSDTLNVRIVEN